MKRIFLKSLLLLFGLNFYAWAQNPPPREPPKIRDFGWSVRDFGKKSDEKPVVKKAVSENDDGETIRVETNLVRNGVLVLDKNKNIVRGLKKEDFIVAEDGIRQEVEAFSLGDSEKLPRSIVLVIDYSGSLFPYINNSVEAAKVLIDNLNPRDRMAIVTDDVKLIQDFTSDKAALKNSLSVLKEKVALKKDLGQSKQYSALLAVLNEMFDAEDLLPIIIFQTDGDQITNLKPIWEYYKRFYKEDNFSFDDVKAAVEKSGATVYSIIPGIPILGFSDEEKMRRSKIMQRNELLAGLILQKEIYDKDNAARIKSIVDTDSAPMLEVFTARQTSMVDISTLSGGSTSYLSAPEDANRIYPKILRIINGRYIIGYYPTNQEKDGKRRKISIEVRGHPEYRILGRKSYYAGQE